MALQILYVLAFTILAFLAIGNLIRNLLTLGMESQRGFAAGGDYDPERPTAPATRHRPTPHPELLDADGKIINEPLLVMKSVSVEDAREQLDAIFKASPGGETREEG